LVLGCVSLVFFIAVSTVSTRPTGDDPVGSGDLG
jgi:hypothetical protein